MKRLQFWHVLLITSVFCFGLGTAIGHFTAPKSNLPTQKEWDKVLSANVQVIQPDFRLEKLPELPKGAF